MKLLTGLASILLATNLFAGEGRAPPSTTLETPIMSTASTTATALTNAPTENIAEDPNYFKNEGHLNLLYVHVNMQNPSFQTPGETVRIMERIGPYLESVVSNHHLHVDVENAGSINLPFNTNDSCSFTEVINWGGAIDAVLARTHDLASYDGVVYFMPLGTCGFGGFSTTRTQQPNYYGYRVQTFVMNPNAEFTVLHELLHKMNPGFGHAMTEYPDGDINEYGDYCDAMSTGRPGINPGERELRDITALRKNEAGWIPKRIITHDGNYRVWASELKHDDQLFVLPLKDGDATYLSYRHGGNSMFLDHPLTLDPTCTTGVGIRLSEFEAPYHSLRLDVLKDDDEFVSEEYPFTITQTAHTDEYVDFTVRMLATGGESNYDGNCFDGIDNDQDGLVDTEEGALCAYEYTGLTVSSEHVAYGAPFTATCLGPDAGPGYGPSGPGLERIERTENGYVGYFTADCHPYQITCAVPDGVISARTLETVVNVNDCTPAPRRGRRP